MSLFSGYHQHEYVDAEGVVSYVWEKDHDPIPVPVGLSAIEDPVFQDYTLVGRPSEVEGVLAWEYVKTPVIGPIFRESRVFNWDSNQWDSWIDVIGEANEDVSIHVEGCEKWSDGVWRSVADFGFPPEGYTLGGLVPAVLVETPPIDYLERIGASSIEAINQLALDIEHGDMPDPYPLGVPSPVARPESYVDRDSVGGIISLAIANFWDSLRYAGLLPEQVSATAATFDAAEAQLQLAEILSLVKFYIAQTDEMKLTQSERLMFSQMSNILPSIEAKVDRLSRPIVVSPALSVGSPQRIIGWEHSDVSLGAGWMPNKFGSGFVKAVR